MLIVVPFGLWWSAVFAVSILNPLFGWTLVIDDIPPRFWEIAVILIPAIILEMLARWSPGAGGATESHWKRGLG